MPCWGWRDDLVTKGSCFSCREPQFNFQDALLTPADWSLLLASMGTCNPPLSPSPHRHTHTLSFSVLIRTREDEHQNNRRYWPESHHCQLGGASESQDSVSFLFQPCSSSELDQREESVQDFVGRSRAGHHSQQTTSNSQIQWQTNIPMSPILPFTWAHLCSPTSSYSWVLIYWTTKFSAMDTEIGSYPEGSPFYRSLDDLASLLLPITDECSRFRRMGE